MSDMMTLIIFFVLAVGISAICSLSEAGLLSLQRTDVARLVQSGRHSGRIIERMKQDVDRPLAAILTINTIANCFGAAAVGSSAENMWGADGMATASAVLTLFILVFSEIIPKSLGASYGVRLVDVIVVAIRGMMFITWPLTVVLRRISGLLGQKPDDKTTREDLGLAAELGIADGAIDQTEGKVIRNILRLVQTPVRDVMISRSQTVVFPKDLTVEQALAQPQLPLHSRFPIHAAKRDDIVGVVRRDEIYHHLQEHKLDTRLESIATPVQRVRATDSVREVVDAFDHDDTKLLLVEDEHGAFTGILTNRCVWQMLRSA